eukprot:CAMPEP_0172852498 /NCGR_PEP_ID=MMETSP1075-20121228/53852_1 /TAXON_ID=2916 /ORGANISM="Ceratium fusus, Strain PA161109" /LENGTH=33 /DNA_ID= /DNA_START= /DNA_END= /DNA_ORIENTATION=
MTSQVPALQVPCPMFVQSHLQPRMPTAEQWRPS